MIHVKAAKDSFSTISVDKFVEKLTHFLFNKLIQLYFWNIAQIMGMELAALASGKKQTAVFVF
jgi:hypothetical protein